MSCMKVLMDLREHRLRPCPSCGHTWPEEEFVGRYCRLCEAARREESEI